MAVRPSNCDVERNFSFQKNIHTKTRNRLGDGTVEKLVCVKQHLTTGSRSKKQLDIDFTAGSESDSDATICNIEDQVGQTVNVDIEAFYNVNADDEVFYDPNEDDVLDNCLFD